MTNGPLVTIGPYLNLTAAMDWLNPSSVSNLLNLFKSFRLFKSFTQLLCESFCTNASKKMRTCFVRDLVFLFTSLYYVRMQLVRIVKM